MLVIMMSIYQPKGSCSALLEIIIIWTQMDRAIKSPTYNILVPWPPMVWVISRDESKPEHSSTQHPENINR